MSVSSDFTWASAIYTLWSPRGEHMISTVGNIDGVDIEEKYRSWVDNRAAIVHILMAANMARMRAIRSRVSSSPAIISVTLSRLWITVE
jgi:hypothetical protein